MGQSLLILRGYHPSSPLAESIEQKNLHLPGPTGRSNLFKKKFIVLEGWRMGMRRTKEHKSARERPELMR